MNKILIISAFAPGINTAGQAFTLKLLRDLSVDHQIDLCYFCNTASEASLSIKNVNTLSAVYLSPVIRLLHVASLPFLHPLFTSRFNWLLAFKLRSVVTDYDVVFFDFSQVFVYALFLPHTNKYAMAHDVVTQMYGRRKGWLARINTVVSRFSERFVMRRSGAKVFCFSNKDCRLVNEYFNVEADQVDFYLDERIYAIDPVTIKRHNKFVFYGAWGRRENSYGLLWFLTKVMPLLGGQCRFIVIGSGVSEEVRDAALLYGDAVEFAGFVDNPYELLAGARALVAPLFEGAGVKVKVLEALACGTQVIGTEICFEGIDEQLLVHCHNCTNAAEFADILNTLLGKDMQKARAAFLANYPRNTMGSVLRTACQAHQRNR
jgi:glycosyltransferase involved in cell wall biosynthesis